MTGGGRSSLLTLGLIALLGAGCGSPTPAPEPAVHFDFIEELALATQIAPPGAAGAEEAPRARADGDTLLIPPGVRVRYSLELPAAASILFQGLRPWQAERATLRVAVTPHAGERRLLDKLSGQLGRTEIAWRAEEAQVVRLSLAVAEEGGGVAIRRPVVRVQPAGEGAADTAALDRRAIRRLRRVERPNILVYLIDSLRADRLGCYGYEKSVSPAIDAFADRALVFDNATANSSWTKSAVASIFTGLWPGSHRAITRQDKLPADAFTLAEALRGDGYATAGFSTNPSIAEEFGFEQGFDRLTLLDIDSHADEVSESAAAWLDGLERRQPFFLYVHTLDPHDPYLPPPAELERWSPGVSASFAADTNKVVSRLNESLTHRTDAAEMVTLLEALYDGEIAANDRGFAALMEALEQSGRLADTAVFVIADHGEDFGEHGVWRHGSRLTRESLRVPLLVRLPGEHRIGREASLVQQVDILPTVLELLELEVPESVEGESLLPLFAGDRRSAADAPAFVYVRFNPPTRFGVIWRGWKLVAHEGSGGRGDLYHVVDDPEERRNLAGRFPIMRDFLQSMLARKLLDREAGLTAEQAEIKPETERALRALGYIQ